MKDRSKSPFLFISAIFVAIIFFLPAIDTDLGWQLRYGNYFFEKGAFLKENTLTYFLSDYKWSNSYALYQIITSFLFKLGGFWALSITYSLLMGFSYVLFNKINPKLPKLNFLFFLLICVFGWGVFRLGFRSQIFTFTFTIALILLISKAPKNKRLYFFIPLIFPLWVNLHGGFILGLILLFFAFLQSLFDRKLEEAKYIGFSLITSFLGTLINPFGLGVYKEVFNHIQTPLGTLVAEWVPPNDFYKFVIFAVSTIILYTLFVSQKKSKVFWILTIITFSYLAYTAKRNLPLISLIWILVSFHLYKSIYALEQKDILKKSTNIILIGGMFILIMMRGKTFEINSSWQKYCKESLLPLPCLAVEYIKMQKLEGKNVFSSYEWGGFLEWQLPSYIFFVDGRTPTWPTPEGISPYSVYLGIIQAQPGYQEILDKHKTDWLLIGAGTFLDLELQNNNNTWIEIYRDEISAIYTKK